VDDATLWAKANNKNTAGLERMIVLRNTIIKDGDCNTFASQGNVGPAKK
jgi:hypothetical protein